MHTGPIPAIVSAEIIMNLVIGSDYSVPVSAHFYYSAHEPFSVSAAFHAGDNDVRWVFGRELLSEGSVQPTGVGDVTCWPATIAGERVVCIALRSPSGQALLEAPADDIAAFLQRSYEVVPQGHESGHLDLDGLIFDLLDSSGQ